VSPRQTATENHQRRISQNGEGKATGYARPSAGTGKIHPHPARRDHMKAIKNIAAAAEDPDDKLRDRMYDDIDRVIVFDNENLKIEWKFDVAFQLP